MRGYLPNLNSIPIRIPKEVKVTVELKDIKKLMDLIRPTIERGYVDFDKPRQDIWEKTLRSMGLTKEQINKFYN